MNEELSTKILETLIEEDFGFSGREGSRWGKGEEHDSLVLDRERGIFYFNSRNIVGDPLVYLTRVRGLSFQEAKDKLKEYNYSNTYVYTINTKVGDVVVYPKLVDTFYDLGRASDRRIYWYKRGISDVTIDRFRLGYYNSYSTIPIYMDGTFRQFQLRRDATETEPRRIKSYYKGVGALLFNSDLLKVVDDIYITEGLTDCLRLNQEGIPSVCGNAGATGWVNEWFKYFIHQKNIFVVLDNDSAGRKGLAKVARNLGLYRTKLYTFEGYDDKYDVVNFFQDGGTKEEFVNLIKEKSKMLFEIEKEKVWLQK